MSSGNISNETESNPLTSKMTPEHFLWNSTESEKIRTDYIFQLGGTAVSPPPFNSELSYSNEVSHYRSENFELRLFCHYEFWGFNYGNYSEISNFFVEAFYIENFYVSFIHPFGCKLHLFGWRNWFSRIKEDFSLREVYFFIFFCIEKCLSFHWWEFQSEEVRYKFLIWHQRVTSGNLPLDINCQNI